MRDPWPFCPSRSPATARRCCRELHHDGDHVRTSKAGQWRETWPRGEHEDEGPPRMRFGELLGHLRDLIDLARNEGYGRFVGVLERADKELRLGPRMYAKRRRKRPRSLFR